MRLPLAIAFLIAAVAAQAAPTLTLPMTPGASAVAILRTADGDFSLSIPPNFPVATNPRFGAAGDVDANVALVGAPSYADYGGAFLYSSTTGEHLHTLSPVGSANQFGAAVLLAGGSAYVGAPGFGTNDGGLFVYDISSGALTDSRFPLGDYYGLGAKIEIRDGYVMASIYEGGTGQELWTPIALVPEPGAMLLALLGVAAGCCRRRCC